MDERRSRHGKRRPARRGTRLALIVVLNGAALWVLWRLALAGGLLGGVSAAGAQAAAEVDARSQAGSPAQQAVAEPFDPVEARDLRRAVLAVVEGARRKAATESRGGFAANQVRVAVHARAVGSKTPLVAHGDGRPMRPASNLKLFTTAAALFLLGPDACFETTFEAGGEVRGGVLQGDLVVRAGGDPLYEADGSGRVQHFFVPVVEALRRAGIDRIGGDLVLDAGGFPDPAPAVEWPDATQHGAEYCALAGGFSANGGRLTARVVPASVGRAARVEFRPRGHGLELDCAVKTKAKGSLAIDLGVIGGRVRAKGSIAKTVPEWSASFAHPDPVALFGEVLLDALERSGIRVEGELVRERGARGGRKLVVLARPIVDTFVPINTDSKNSVADQLFLATGLAVWGDPTRKGGARAAREALRRRGVEAEGLVMVDGSGLSRANRASARQIVALLEAALESEGDSGVYRASLARAGESGTLKDRMVGTEAASRVLAKSGWIAGTSALSGVAVDLQGREILFSILVEYPVHGGLNTSCFKPMQDEICRLLVRGATP